MHVRIIEVGVHLRRGIRQTAGAEFLRHRRAGRALLGWRLRRYQDDRCRHRQDRDCPHVYLEGTDPCAQARVICQDDAAIITLNPINSAGTYVGALTGWLGFAYDGYGYSGGLTQVAQLGYPVALDGGLLMERTDSLGIIDGNCSNNTIIGSLMTDGSSGGPWVLNLALPPSLAGTAFGQAAGLTGTRPAMTSKSMFRLHAALDRRCAGHRGAGAPPRYLRARSPAGSMRVSVVSRCT